MNNRALVVGIAAGLAAAVLLFYPLYVVLPGQYVAGWPRGAAGLGLALEVAAGLLAGAGGFIAARWNAASSRGQGARLGALAGGLAGFVAFCGLGAAAAGVAGAGDLLAHGPLPAADEREFMYLLIESIVRTVWWTYEVAWLLIAGGAMLGAVGGVTGASRAREKPAPASEVAWRRMGMAAAIAALLSTSMTFIVNVVIFRLLPTSARLAAGRNNLTPSLSLDGLFYWPVGTAAALYLGALAWQAAAIRGEARRAEHRLHLGVLASAAYTASLIPPGLIAMIFLVNRPFAITWMSALIALVSLALAAYLFVAGSSLSRRARAAARPEPSALRPALIRAVNWREWVMLSLALGLVVMGPGIVGAVAASLNLVLAPVAFIIALSNYPGPAFDPNLVAGFTSAAVAQSLYRSQAISALAGIAISAAVMGVATAGVRAAALLLVTRATRQGVARK